jgi:glycosyltransferase involved in cell wall biosynthesis
MRVLFLNPGGSLGGAERSLLDLVASVRAHSPAIELGLVVASDGPLVEEAERMDMRVIRLPFGNAVAQIGDSAFVTHGARGFAPVGRHAARAVLDAASYAYRLRAALREFAPSVVHSNGIKMHLLAAAVRGRAPLVWHIRDFVGERPLVSRALRAVAGRVDAAIAISNAVAVDARSVLPRLPITVVHNAIDTDLFAPAGSVANLDALAGCESAPPGTVRIGLVATYARWKGHEVFLEAACLMKSASFLPGVRFYVIGGPIYETAASQYRQEELSALVRRLGIAASVRFVPFHRNVDEVYRALDIVVHASSRPEPFGRTIAEAMATGKPVVASREGGAQELFKDGEDAIGVPPRDPGALARALRELVADVPRRDRLGAAARAVAVEYFSRARLAKQVFSVYRRAGCAESGPPGESMV